jgi:hypothetical protein
MDTKRKSLVGSLLLILIATPLHANNHEQFRNIFGAPKS